MALAKIVYASMTGNTEEIADIVAEAFENMDTLKENAVMYGKLCSEAADDLADRILKKVK